MEDGAGLQRQGEGREEGGRGRAKAGIGIGGKGCVVSVCVGGPRSVAACFFLCLYMVGRWALGCTSCSRLGWLLEFECDFSSNKCDYYMIWRMYIPYVYVLRAAPIFEIIERRL
jgi:hypothetical protein